MQKPLGQCIGKPKVPRQADINYLLRRTIGEMAVSIKLRPLQGGEAVPSPSSSQSQQQNPRE